MFRCFFLAPDGHFVGAKEVEEPEEYAAIEEARRVLRAGEVRRATGFEVWCGARMIFSSAPRPLPSAPPPSSGLSAPGRPGSGAFRHGGRRPMPSLPGSPLHSARCAGASCRFTLCGRAHREGDQNPRGGAWTATSVRNVLALCAGSAVGLTTQAPAVAEARDPGSVGAG